MSDIEYLIGNIPEALAHTVAWRLRLLSAPAELRKDDRPGRMALVTSLRWRGVADRLLEQLGQPPLLERER